VDDGEAPTPVGRIEALHPGDEEPDAQVLVGELEWGKRYELEGERHQLMH